MGRKCLNCLERRFGMTSKLSEISRLIMIDDEQSAEESTISDCIIELKIELDVAIICSSRPKCAVMKLTWMHSLKHSPRPKF